VWNLFDKKMTVEKQKRDKSGEIVIHVKCVLQSVLFNVMEAFAFQKIVHIVAPPTNGHRICIYQPSGRSNNAAALFLQTNDQQQQLQQHAVYLLYEAKMMSHQSSFML